MSKAKDLAKKILHGSYTPGVDDVALLAEIDKLEESSKELRLLKELDK